MEWTAPEIVAPNEPFASDERAMLEGHLDWQRATLLGACAGLTAEQLALRATPPSGLSLLGLVRHLAAVERAFFRRRVAGEDVPPLYRRPDGSDAAFEDATPEHAEAAVAALIAEQECCRAAVAGIPLDATHPNARWGPMSLRWVYLHLIAEYALHTGHAELLRERIDGATGG